ncbi:hypothetical protein ACP70R_016130 [Stipagrostis hirtigluma subsp. patula]
MAPPGKVAGSAPASGDELSAVKAVGEKEAPPGEVAGTTAASSGAVKPAGEKEAKPGEVAGVTAASSGKQNAVESAGEKEAKAGEVAGVTAASSGKQSAVESTGEKEAKPGEVAGVTAASSGKQSAVESGGEKEALHGQPGDATSASGGLELENAVEKKYPQEAEEENEAVAVEEEAYGNKAAPLPHLDNNIISLIATMVPTKCAYRFTALATFYRFIVSEPPFLKRHLKPCPLLAGDVPGAIIIQPKGLTRCGYIHLTAASLDPANPIALKLQVHPKYAIYAEHAPGAADAAPPPEHVDIFTFFERTIPMFDLCIVATHGRLMLARSQASGRHFVCNPSNNRWVVLPQAPVASDRNTASGLWYDHDTEPGAISFVVVLLVRVRRRNLLLQKFSSDAGVWETQKLDFHGGARLLGQLSRPSPGIYAGDSFYWQSQARADRILCLDLARGRASVLFEPPEAEGSTNVRERSLGSAGGVLRMPTFSIRDTEPENNQPHDILGVHSLWMLEAGGWRRTQQVVVRDSVSMSFGFIPYGIEIPFDFASARTGDIVVQKNGQVLGLDVWTGEKRYLTDLYLYQRGRINELYGSFDVFPLFM